MLNDPTRPQTQRSRQLANLRSGVAALLGIVFLGTGISKLASVPYIVQTFQAWGYPTWFLYAIGLVEVFCAILVLVPATRPLGAALLAVEMVGAIGTHVVAHQWAFVPLPLTMLALSVLLVSALRRRFEPGPMPHGPSMHAH